MSGWAIFGIVVGAIALLVTILLMIPVHVVLKVDNKEINATAHYTLYKKVLLPEEEKPKKKKKKKKKKSNEVVEKIKEDQLESTSFSEIIKLLSDVKELASVVLKKLGKNITLRVEEYDILVAGFDAATVALIYGGLQAVFSNLFAVLEGFKWFSVSEKCIGIHADFLEAKSSAKFLLTVKLSVIKALIILSLWNEINEE